MRNLQTRPIERWWLRSREMKYMISSLQAVVSEQILPHASTRPPRDGYM